VRILVFHGYLLAGTGSNVYNARLAAAFVRQGHEVHLLCQDRHPEQQGFVSAVGDWDAGSLRVRELRGGAPPGVGEAEAAGAGHCTAYRPDIGGLLLVYVSDRYEGIQARTFAECSDEEVARYAEANVTAVRELVELVSPDVALANHLVMGPAILARALGGRVPYAVKVHGSALEYTVKPEPERFLPYAREGVAGAAGILVGSHHTAASLWQALADPQIERRTRLGPPGVDVERFAPRERLAARAELDALSARLRALPQRREAVAGDDLAVERELFHTLAESSWNPQHLLRRLSNRLTKIIVRLQKWESLRGKWRSLQALPRESARRLRRSLRRRALRLW